MNTLIIVKNQQQRNDIVQFFYEKLTGVVQNFAGFNSKYAVRDFFVNEVLQYQKDPVINVKDNQFDFFNGLCVATEYEVINTKRLRLKTLGGSFALFDVAYTTCSSISNMDSLAHDKCLESNIQVKPFPFNFKCVQTPTTFNKDLPILCTTLKDAWELFSLRVQDGLNSVSLTQAYQQILNYARVNPTKMLKSVICNPGEFILTFPSTKIIAESKGLLHAGSKVNLTQICNYKKLLETYNTVRNQLKPLAHAFAKESKGLVGMYKKGWRRQFMKLNNDLILKLQRLRKLLQSFTEDTFILSHNQKEICELTLSEVLATISPYPVTALFNLHNFNTGTVQVYSNKTLPKYLYINSKNYSQISSLNFLKDFS